MMAVFFYSLLRSLRHCSPHFSQVLWQGRHFIFVRMFVFVVCGWALASVFSVSSSTLTPVVHPLPVQSTDPLANLAFQLVLPMVTLRDLQAINQVGISIWDENEQLQSDDGGSIELPTLVSILPSLTDTDSADH